MYTDPHGALPGGARAGPGTFLVRSALVVIDPGDARIEQRGEPNRA